jgi:hypothetical protein
MNEVRPRHPIAQKRVLHDMPGTADVEVRRASRYSAADTDTHTLDIYYPPHWTGASLPAVVLVSGLPDAGAMAFLGCRIKDMESFVSWGRLIAASGVIAVTHTTGTDPAADLSQVIEYLQASGNTHGIDASRLGLWACSSHVPNALGQLMRGSSSLKCAALCYGFMLDLDGSTGVAEAQRTWRFANPAAGRPVSDLPADTPLCVVRCGRDATPHVNGSLDRFVQHALAANLPLTLVNHHVAPHAFDLDHDSDTTRWIVSGILTFLQTRLASGARPNSD